MLALKAKVVVLAAGALATPVLLLNSRSGEWPKRIGQRLRFGGPQLDAPSARAGSRSGPNPELQDHGPK